MLARLVGLFAIVPTTLILTVSFFVLFALRKVDGKSLKVFGYILAALLWASALLLLSDGVYTLATGRCPMKKMMHRRAMSCAGMMDKNMMDGQTMMDKGKMPEMKR